MSTETQPSAPPTSGRFARWHGRILGFCLIVFALEIGMFLILFPWLSWWGMSYVPVYMPHWAGLWMSRYFRGAVSGLGLLNVFVAGGELVRQLRAVLRR